MIAFQLAILSVGIGFDANERNRILYGFSLRNACNIVTDVLHAMA
jgi:hypothetical protein